MYDALFAHFRVLRVEAVFVSEWNLLVCGGHLIAHQTMNKMLKSVFLVKINIFLVCDSLNMRDLYTSRPWPILHWHNMKLIGMDLRSSCELTHATSST